MQRVTVFRSASLTALPIYSFQRFLAREAKKVWSLIGRLLLLDIMLTSRCILGDAASTDALQEMTRERDELRAELTKCQSETQVLVTSLRQVRNLANVFTCA